MYLFTKTIFSQCPNEGYCITMTILSIIAMIVQLTLVFYLIKNYKRSNNDYIKFLTFTKIATTIVYTFVSIFIEVKTFFPRKIIACYGLVRYFGNYGCGFSMSLIIPAILFECLFILYAFNGQFNTLCRKKKFHQNNLIQKLSFALTVSYSLTIFCCFVSYYGIKEKLATIIFSNYPDILFLVNDNYTITGLAGTNGVAFPICITAASIFCINYIVHYVYIFNKMLKFIKEMKKLSQISNQRNNSINKFNHHIINVIIPIILIYIPIGIFLICVTIYKDDEYLWITTKLSNMIVFTLYLYGIFSPSYVLYFILTSELKTSSVSTKNTLSKNSERNRKK
uniref:G_PROTEIN_RECEP_F1_2 domain-containing protein n=1 Tax=Strongyloides venezuelensis TaxID=75913 RepID=A0A0K0G614_STRVS